MQAIHILDVKPFMQYIFQTGELDSYSFVSGELRTDMTYNLDGRINKAFFLEEELSALEMKESDYLKWSMAKEKVFSLIKGKKTPTYMKLVLRLPTALTDTLLADSGCAFSSSDIDGMFLNILFQEEKLNVICGISYKIFTLDKNLEDYFSSNIVTLLKSNRISVE